MNAFQILDKNNNPIPINQLDREVCELWQVPYHEKWYASEYPRGHFKDEIKWAMQSNWYDTIGWMIASENKSFEDIIEYYKDTMKEFLGQKDEHGTIITIEYIYPKRMLLLKTWIEKGYQPKQIITE